MDGKLDYRSACHAMQTGVAIKMEMDPLDTTPKHLRVGVNSAMSALVRLLIEKGLFTEDEYTAAITNEMNREVERYQQWLKDRGMSNVTLR